MRDHGPITRADVARTTHLSPVTVSATVRLLIQQGFVREAGPTLTPAGKRATLLEFVGDVFYVVAVVADGSSLTAACFDLSGHRLSGVHRRGVDTPAAVERELPPAVDEALAGRARDRLLAVGVAVTGTVDPQRGVVQESGLFGIRRWPLGARVSQALGGVAVVVENDVNALLVGDRYVRAHRDRANILAVCLTQGVGGAILVRGSIYHGHDHVAGELGALSTQGRDGSTCTLEQAVGERFLLERLRRSDPSFAAADPGALERLGEAPLSPAARAVVDDAADRLVRSVVNAAVLLAPDEVVFAARPWGARLFGEPMRRALASELSHPVPLRILDDPVAAELAGAAALAMSVTPLTDPLSASPQPGQSGAPGADLGRHARAVPLVPTGTASSGAGAPWDRRTAGGGPSAAGTRERAASRPS
ncbi:MAG: ROK family protein [Firmicutes bacterium]|nr:ROK family protein [Bacillota bacterium]